MHPLHNFAFVAYDPSLVTVPVTAATLASGEGGGLAAGDRAWLLGLCSDRLDAGSATTVVCRQTTVDTIGWQKRATLPHSSAIPSSARARTTKQRSARTPSNWQRHTSLLLSIRAAA